MRVLILSCNTGGGHNTAAKAIQEVLALNNDYCEVKDALSFGSQLASDLVCDTYIEMVKKTPWIFGELYNFSEKLGQITTQSKVKLRSPVYLINKIYADDLKEYILKNNFDYVICTHIFPAEAMTSLVKRNLNLPVFFIVTDYACPPMLEETRMSLIFAPHVDSINTFTNKGIPKEIIIPTGIPVSQKFTLQANKESSRNFIGIQQNAKAYLIMTGSMGYGDSLDICKQILINKDEKTKIVVLTGKNEKLHKEFEKTFTNDNRILLVSFTDKVSYYMDACDVLLTKPGGLSSTEALVKGIPIIHTSPIPGCETENAEFFINHHLSLCATDSENAATLAIKLMNDDFLKNQIIQAQKHYKYANSAQEIIKQINQYIKK